MKRYSGPFFTDEGFIQAQIEIEEGEVKEYKEGGDGGEDAIILPTFYNSHAHLGDSVVKEPPTGTIEEIVGPGGLKEKALSSSTEEEKSESIARYLTESISCGVRTLFDFREGGLEGLEPLKRALDSVDLEGFSPVIMSRPSKKEFDAWELNQILSIADGIGLSAYRDWDEAQIKKIADSVRGSGKPLAMHCSEDVREPVEEITDLGIHHLVHMIEATEEDLQICSDEDIPIVVCPRANMFFGKTPDISKMLDYDLTLSLGTDNAMISNPNLFRELETAYRTARLKGEISPEEILNMATWNPRRSLKTSSIKEEKDSLMILKYRNGDPAYNVVIDSSPQDIIEVVRWKNTKE
ncbi:MAG: amidohydrolase family protein [Candidatus Thermoplasmatota archaeon]|nr:amidohydrolase family protein [Candidatus Thermoplasmatota archaeon]